MSAIGLVVLQVALDAIWPVPGTVLLGVGSAAAVWGLRYAIRRRREAGEGGSADGPRSLEPAGAGSGIAIASRRGSAAPSVALRIPTPFADRDPVVLDHAELYAVEVGLVGGGLVAWFASLAVVDPLVGTLLGAGMGAASFWRVRTRAAPTIRQATAPWIAATVVGALIGVLLFF